MPDIRIIKGGLDEEKDGRITLRGVICPDDLPNIKFDDYQRDNLGKNGILNAMLKNERFDDVVLGMRGGRVTIVGDSYFLKDAVYGIDGRQRISAAIRAREIQGDVRVRLGAKIYFDTDKTIETEMFEKLNLLRTKISPNKLLFNKKSQDHIGVATLYGLSVNDRSFPLFERVSWSQNMKRGELITAMMLSKTAVTLHSHKTTIAATAVNAIVDHVDTAAKEFKPQIFRENVKTFFCVLDACFGISAVQIRQEAPFIKETFMSSLARIFSEHPQFWDKDTQTKFFVDSGMRAKLGKFPVMDPHVRNLASSSGKARDMLYTLLLDHMNSGKRTHRLVKRPLLPRRKAHGFAPKKMSNGIAAGLPL